MQCEICNSDNIFTKTKNNKTGKILCKKCYRRITIYNTTKTRYDPNEYIIFDDYTEIKLCDIYGNYKASALINTQNTEKCKKHKWYLDTTGYVRTTINREKVRLHNYLFDNFNHEFIIDHKDGNKLDNRYSNLQKCSQQFNTLKKSKQKNNTSNIIGVSKNHNNWHQT